MAVVPVTLMVTIYPKNKTVAPYPATIVGYAWATGLQVGGGPMPGGDLPHPEHPIALPPVDKPPPDMIPSDPKPPPSDGGWGWSPEYGWGYFPGPGEARPKR